MPDMSPKKHPMPQQNAKNRARNFDEVALGYDEETAVNEAMRCLSCKDPPCVSGCPVNVRIPQFIAKIKEGDFEGAYSEIERTSSLPAVCGRVCPQESQCESKCVRGKKGEPVGIGRLERFAADRRAAKAAQADTTPKRKAAIVGSGPAGLACAGDLAKKGYSVTVFEALHTPGGVLMYGIPQFRLPKSIVENEIDELKALGVEIKTNVIIGKTLTVDELFDMGYEAVFIGSGAGLPNFMGIPGENLNGVYSANEYLTRSNLMKAYLDDSQTPIMTGKKAAVIGGGNVAMDAARTALRLGAEKVYVIYRRSMQELPARAEEVEHAIEEGVELMLLCAPVEIIGYGAQEEKQGFVKALRCVKMRLGEPDDKGRRRPEKIEGSDFVLDADTVIIAVGTSPNPLIKDTTNGLDVNERGGIIVTEDALTSRDRVFAGGDAVTGAATVISAMGAGKKAAQSICKMLGD